LYDVSNHDGFIDAYRPIRTEMERFALFLERNRDAAADLLHDALESALKAWKRIDDTNALRAYLVAAMIRLHRRGKQRNARWEGADMESLSAPAGTSADVATDMRLLRDAIADLPDDQRVAFVLAEVEGWPIADIAQVLGIGASAVKMRVKRGRDRLREVLTDPHTTPEEVRHA